ncbi:hypothetical protein CEUSTIGMA_g11332.t1 [Chlamydomonas eustigma]|uniref:DNA mismatch repair proteins mutS family domain-containing protein n=1 Tax=Chlamydomonas eustigma TaxID=1157962 RepID=A0A250XLF8_9CHLO|nr:hypothetical protein CEUSTIGMA_g11332.t1 [Chlamydomonas eustigma]|eukprot:GAX83908.1 hypothetical protein CEUSTIGMA_g11332.t1 [Chlamydomonas eustigma]
MSHEIEDVNEAKTSSKTIPDLIMDERTSGGFNAWFLSLSQDSGKVRFFDRKGFYTVHGDNAIFVARTFYKTTSVIRYYGSEGKRLDSGEEQSGQLASVALNRSLFENALKELLLEGSQHTVEMYEGTGCSWRLTKTASPGKLLQFEEELFKSSDGGSDMPTVMAVFSSFVQGQRTVGVGFADVSGRRLGACQFVDDDRLCSLEAVIIQLGVRECVLLQEAVHPAVTEITPSEPQTAADRVKLVDLLSRCGVMATERPKAFFSTKHLQTDLAKLVKSGTVEHHADVLERPLACSALAAVVAFSELLSDASKHQKFELVLYDPGRFMRLDASAQRALNVMASRQQESAPQNSATAFSLIGLMGRARTAMGKRRLKTWLKQPLVRVDDIKVRHNVVEAMVEDAEMRERLRDQHLRGLPDIERLVRRLEMRKLGLPELCQLYRASAILPLVEDVLRCHSGPHASLLKSRYADVLAVAHDGEHLTKFEELLEAAVDLDAIPEEYLICASYDQRLKSLKDQKSGVEEEVDRIAFEVAKDLGLELGKTIKLEWHRFSNTKSRCLRITQKEEKVVRAKLNAKYKTIESRKDGTKFTNRSLEKTAERLSAVLNQYEDLQRELVDQVVSVAQTFVEVWDGISSLIAELDVLVGFADLTVTAPCPYVRPTLLPAESGEITLVGSRHPCVEAQDGIEFIKNDCSLVRGDSWFQVITGPNMGGKSTFIRQVGVCILMAQVGCFVPCDSARISVRDAIFARVGAGDCQQKGVSTFMAEMLDTAAILKGATEKSLIIIDELGRGTSTSDGFGLAWAIAEQIMEHVGAPTLFATHFHELKTLQGRGGVRNQHVAAALDKASRRLTMLYQIRPGPCDESFGIQVAESANFPTSVVALAKQKLADLESAQGIHQSRKRKFSHAVEDDALVFLKALPAVLSDRGECAKALKEAQGLLDKVQQSRNMKSVS